MTESPFKYHEKITSLLTKCKCSHSVLISYKCDRVLCSYCGHYVYKDKQTEFKYKLKDELKRNMR